MHSSTLSCYYHDEVLPDFVNAYVRDQLPVICDNLVGVKSRLGYLRTERRANCLQMPPAPSQSENWEYDFVITRTKESDEVLYLDHGSCQNRMYQILIGNITGCGSEVVVPHNQILSGTQLVGVFNVQ